MANPDHLRVLKQGVEPWNKWRIKNSSLGPDLTAADLHGRDLREIDFRGTDLREANLRNTVLRKSHPKEGQPQGGRTARL